MSIRQKRRVDPPPSPESFTFAPSACSTAAASEYHPMNNNGYPPCQAQKAQMLAAQALPQVVLSSHPRYQHLDDMHISAHNANALVMPHSNSMASTEVHSWENQSSALFENEWYSMNMHRWSMHENGLSGLLREFFQLTLASSSHIKEPGTADLYPGGVSILAPRFPYRYEDFFASLVFYPFFKSTCSSPTFQANSSCTRHYMSSSWLSRMYISTRVTFIGMVTGIYYLRKVMRKCNLQAGEGMPNSKPFIYNHNGHNHWSVFIRRRFRLLVAVCTMLAMKYHHDRHFSNVIWSQVSGFHLELLNTMERFVLYALDYSLWMDCNVGEYYELFCECSDQCSLSSFGRQSTMKPDAFNPRVFASDYSGHRRTIDNKLISSVPASRSLIDRSDFIRE